MSDLQKRFEAWLEAEFGMWAIPVSGKYKSRQTQAMWEAWQAALQSQTAPQPDHIVDANKMASMLREIVDMWDGPRYALQMKPLIDRARKLLQEMSSEMSSGGANVYDHSPDAGKVVPVAWRDVVGFEGIYQVSSLGDIRNTGTGKVLAKNLMGKGYIKASLWRDGVQKQTSAHRVVAEAFIPKPEGKDEVNHIDGDKTNNRASNLEWCDRKSNVHHSRYVLGNDVKPVTSIDGATGERIYYPSIEEAGRRDGQSASGVYDALNGIKKTHAGKRWEFTHPAQPRNEVQAEALEKFAVFLRQKYRLGVTEQAHEFLDLLRSNGGDD